MYVERASDDEMYIYGQGENKLLFFFLFIFLSLFPLQIDIKGRLGSFPTQYNLKSLKS